MVVNICHPQCTSFPRSPLRHFPIFFQFIPLQWYSLSSNKLFCIYMSTCQGQSISHHIKGCQKGSEITFFEGNKAKGRISKPSESQKNLKRSITCIFDKLIFVKTYFLSFIASIFFYWSFSMKYFKHSRYCSKV